MSGREEYPDPEPLEWPLGLSRPLTLQEEIQRYLRVERAMGGGAQEWDTEEEANDFDVEDDEGDLAAGVDAMEMAADRRYEEALREFDEGLSNARKEKMVSEKRSHVAKQNPPAEPGDGGSDEGATVAGGKPTR